MSVFGKLVLVAGVVLLVSGGLAGCGEREQVVVYKQGKYQGKPDTRPWDSPEWGGDQAKWEQQVDKRTLGQNEYVRIGH